MRLRAAPLLLALIHRSAWKEKSAKFAFHNFLEHRLYRVLGRWSEPAHVTKKAGATTHTPALMIRSLWLSATQSRSLFSRSSSCAPPLAIDHPLAGVGSFYGGVNHAYVEARAAYGPVEGVAVVDVEHVVAGATVGRVVVVGVVLGPQVIVAVLSVDVVCHPVAELLEDYLVALRWRRRGCYRTGSLP